MAAESFLIKILVKVGDKIFDAIWDTTYEKFKDRLKPDEVRNALIKATNAAIDDYEFNQGNSPQLVMILRSSDAFLNTELVIQEFKKLYSFNDKPDVRAITCWFFETGNPTIEQQDQVSIFISGLNVRMRAEKELLSWFQTNDLSRIAEAVEKLAAQMPEFSRYLINDALFIQDKARNFVGRNWLFSAIDNFIANPHYKSGYFMITGDPGIGKSAIMAKMASDHAWVHHFNQRREGKNKPGDFIQNICTQLIAAYRLNPKDYMPFDISSSATLENILNALSERPGLWPVVLLVDALDEIEGKELKTGANPLFLPQNLPPGIFIILSVRNDERYFPAVYAEFEKKPIERDGTEHKRDVFDYLTSLVTSPDIQTYLREKDINEETFISDIAHKSEYNFMYLSLVIPELTKTKGVYHLLSLQELPEGLKGYYRDHWQIMKTRSGADWFRLTLPVLVALSLEHLPISVEWIQKLIPNYYEIVDEKSEQPSKGRIRSTLNELSAFVHSESIDGTERFRLYHESFYDFIRERNEIREERIELEQMQEALTNQLKASFDEMD